ncbi:Seed linoleate 9S-lipoxygenase [Vigna angularis]|uniref:Lipoxygenase n=1 Tax=Phaseolus angularis TaxID=3914 RepID=A0A8T0JQA2_PHAAN|nr:Seed linoleate 9S-lipoxygenase [Vigna angularis]
MKWMFAENGSGKVGKKTYLEGVISTIPTLTAEECAFDVHFDWDIEDMGIPGTFTIRNHLLVEFFLVSLTLEDVPNRKGPLHFVCNSWLYNHHLYDKDRVFFSNESVVETISSVQGLVATGIKIINDSPELDITKSVSFKLISRNKSENACKLAGKVGKDAYLENNVSVLRTLKETLEEFDIYFEWDDKDMGTPGGNYEEQAEVYYVPRDENFSDEKTAEFFILAKKALGGSVEPLLLSLYLKTTSNEFNGFEEVLKMYEGGVNLPLSITGNGNPSVLDFPTPDVIKESKFAWMTDEEFAREMIAGVNPLVIRLLKKEELALPKNTSCNCIQRSTVTKEILEKNMNGVKVDKAFANNKLFILDYYEAFMAYLGKINDLPSAKAYATRTFLFLQDDGTLKPLAIELNKPHQCPCDHPNVETTVVLPADKGVESTIWLLAKAHVVVNDTNYHQLISHWLHTHAVIEPFAISTNRNLSVLHPIYKLLHPHFRDTLNINSLARKSLISAGSVIEQTFLPGPYSMEMSSAIYKNWVFADQALPKDLIKRGLAFEDDANDLKLVIEDYPYAVDGLEIWNATKLWVQDYVALYYSDDQAIQGDAELQAWWKEVVEKGHGDLKAQWSKMHTSHDLVETCTTIIWIASALHAAVNFGQYPYGGYIMNRPTQSRRWIPKPGTQEYDEMTKNPQEAYLKTITPKYQAVVDLSVMELLSTHASDEVYLGQRNSLDWTAHQEAKDLFRRFTDDLRKIENEISDRNSNEGLKNRTGPVKMPYTLLLPTSKPGMTFRGIPNSVSI